MYNFNALLSRMKYIPRWSLMRQSRPEDVAQHTREVMFLAHTLGRIATEIFSRQADVPKMVLCRLYHDVSEILTGDMPTPVKYNNPRLQQAYKDMEKSATAKLLRTAQPRIQKQIEPFVMGYGLSDYEKRLIKAADKLRALIKCTEELNSGNREFESAYRTTLQSLEDMEMDEVKYFMENMLEGYGLTLDELAKI